MKLKNKILLFLYVLSSLSLLFSLVFADTISVCVIGDNEEIEYMLRSIAEDNNFIILEGEFVDSGVEDLVDGIDEECLGLVLENYGANCELDTGELSKNRFYINVEGTYYPQDSRCTYSSCIGSECAWAESSSLTSDSDSEVEEESTSSIVTIEENESLASSDNYTFRNTIDSSSEILGTRFIDSDDSNYLLNPSTLSSVNHMYATAFFTRGASSSYYLRPAFTSKINTLEVEGGNVVNSCQEFRSSDYTTLSCPANTNPQSMNFNSGEWSYMCCSVNN